MKTKRKLLIALSIVMSLIVILAILFIFYLLGISGRFNVVENERLISKTELMPVLNLDRKASYLIHDMAQDTITLEVAQFKEEPLYEQIIVNYNDREEPEIQGDLPWFYYSPNVIKVSPTSYANKIRLILSEEFNDYAWYETGDELLLYQGTNPFTGWYTTNFDGWWYFKDGVEQGINISNLETKKILETKKMIQFLLPDRTKITFYQEQPTHYIDVVERSTVYEHILYKNPNQMIFTSPPGTKGSFLLTTTKDFVDMPMEVVQEVVTSEGAWIQVMLGYDELGWLPKDDTYTNYVRTYYSEQELLDTIETVLAEEIAYIDANVGASFINNETMSQVSVNNQVFFPASTQKIYIMGEVYRQYAQGILSPYDTVELNSWDKVPGAGVIQEYPDGSVFTIDELVDLVMIYSDNTAANLLIDTVGGGSAINPKVHQIGLLSTYVDGKYYQSAGSGFTTSPYDAARFFAYLYNDRINGAPWDEQLISKFYLNTHNFLRNYIPESTRSWNKSGLGETEQNDVATFVTPYGSYSLAVYTSYPANYKGISDAVGQLSRRVHDVFNEIRSDLWITVTE